MSTVLEQKAQEIKRLRGELFSIFESHGGPQLPNAPQAEIKNILADIQGRNEALNGLAKEYESLRAADAVYQENQKALEALDQVASRMVHPGAPNGAPDQTALSGGDGRSQKSLAQMFLESPAYKQRPKQGQGPSSEVKVDRSAMKFLMGGVKAVMVTSSGGPGYPPQVLRSGEVTPIAYAAPTLLDFIPVRETTMNAYVFMLQTARTNSAAETAEGVAVASEASITYTPTTSPIARIPVIFRVSDEELEDQVGIEEMLNNEMALMIRQRLNTQIISGNGTSPNLTGLVNVSGVQTYARPANQNQADAIRHAMTLVRTNGLSATGSQAEPSAVFFNPVDWETIRLTKTSTGQYVWGDPSTVGMERIWGLPKAEHVAVPIGTAIVADFQMFTKVVYRTEIIFDVTNSHATDFEQGVQAIRATLRAGFVVNRPDAVCLVSGL